VRQGTVAATSAGNPISASYSPAGAGFPSAAGSVPSAGVFGSSFEIRRPAMVSQTLILLQLVFHSRIDRRPEKTDGQFSWEMSGTNDALELEAVGQVNRPRQWQMVEENDGHPRMVRVDSFSQLCSTGGSSAGLASAHSATTAHRAGAPPRAGGVAMPRHQRLVAGQEISRKRRPESRPFQPIHRDRTERFRPFRSGRTRVRPAFRARRSR
jgi:hypothetical protein